MGHKAKETLSLARWHLIDAVGWSAKEGSGVTLPVFFSITRLNLHTKPVRAAAPLIAPLLQPRS